MKNKGLILVGALALLLSGCASVSSNKEVNPLDYIELGEYKGISVIRPVHEVTEEELDEEINMLLSTKAEIEEIKEGVVKDGDVVNIDYCGKKDGVAFEGGTAEGYNLTIGSHSFIEGFEEGLKGVKIGDTVDLNLTFPEDYFSEELAGSDVIFTVTVNHVEVTNLPEFTDEFVKEISEGEYLTTVDYTESLKGEIVSQYTEYLDAQMYEDLWNKVLNSSTIKKDLPSSILQDKVSKMLLNAQSYAKNCNMEFEDFLEQYMGLTKDQFNKQAADYAEVAAKESLVLKAICDKEGISLSEEEINQAVDEYVGLYGFESAEQFREENDMEQFEEYILTSKVQEFLADNAVISVGTEEEAEAQRAKDAPADGAKGETGDGGIADFLNK